MVPSFEIRCRDLEIIGIDYSTQQSRNKETNYGQRGEKKKKDSFFCLDHKVAQKWGKIYSGWIMFLSKKHFLLYNDTALSEVQQYHFVPIAGMLLIIFY